MKILVADNNDRFLAAVSVAFGRHCELVTATCRDACMDQVERQAFDVVVACDELADYTGLELLSEIASVSPRTLLVFAASPTRLKRVTNRLARFGLFEILSYPPDPRKLLEVLKRARQSLPPRIPHVVLQSEWDTGELPALVVEEEWRTPTNSEAIISWTAHDIRPDQEDMAGGSAVEVGSYVEEVIELQPSAVPVVQALVGKDSALEPTEPTSSPNASVEAQVEREPQWAEDFAANDPTFGTEPAAPAGGGGQSPGAVGSSQPAKSSPADNAAGAKKTMEGPTAVTATQPRVRTPAVPTAAQRAAFERALARRKAGNSGPAHAPTGKHRKNEPEPMNAPLTTTLSGGVEQLRMSDRSAFPVRSGSLSELARMASNKRPLAIPSFNRPGPKRAAFAVGSGLAAVVVLGVLTFELLRTPHTAAHAMPTARAANTQLFSPSGSLVANSQPIRPFDAQPQPSVEARATISSQPQAQTFDPETAPPDPPPPPALEQPGPMEPSETEPPMPMHGIRLPPTGMLPPGYEQYGPQ